MIDLMPERRGWRIGLGITMVVLGFLALGFTAVVGILSAALLGLAVLTGGCIALVAVFRSESMAEAIMMIVLTVMLMFTGVALVADPVRALVALTTVLGTYLFLSGAARIVIALFNRRGSWGWAIVHGIVSLLLGILIWAEWPLSGLVAVGLFVGIELMFIGISWMLGPPAAPQQSTRHRASRRRPSARASSRV
jgi:uncharacterized membrane protein HdeD (DUF308 family)